MTEEIKQLSELRKQNRNNSRVRITRIRKDIGYIQKVPTCYHCTHFQKGKLELVNSKPISIGPTCRLHDIPTNESGLCKSITPKNDASQPSKKLLAALKNM